MGLTSEPHFIPPSIRLVVLQVLLSNLSMLGHLSGIISGYLQLYGFFDLSEMPGEDTLKSMEQWRCLQLLTLTPNFVPTPTGQPFARGPVNFCQGLGGGARTVIRHAGHISERAKRLVFGHESSTTSGLGVSSHEYLLAESDDLEHGVETSGPILSLIPTKDPPSELV